MSALKKTTPLENHMVKRNRYQESIQNPEEFWREQGQIIDWFTPYQKVRDVSYDKKDLHIKWYEDGKLNACYNCIDRHLPQKANDVALIWEGDDPQKSLKVTYQELFEKVCLVANVLKKHGVEKGDRVVLYMPMIPEAIYAMLACARIGAVHSVVFGGFSPASLKDRILDTGAKVVITADGSHRGGKLIPLKENVEEAIKDLPQVEGVLVARHTDKQVPFDSKRDVWLQDEMETVEKTCLPEVMSAEDMLFILYTSGSTNKPKGIVHTTGGYMVYAATTFKQVFDYNPGEVYWCTADVGWITGHSYLVYGPLSMGATTLVYEGVPAYPDASRLWQIVDKHHVNIFYTAPTLIRALMREGEKYLETTSRDSLRLLGTVGEPINPEAWRWYHAEVGKKKSPIVDTWWQTETGGVLISPLPHEEDAKPGAATKPLLGIEPVLVDAEGNLLEGVAEGNLCIAQSWPGQMRTIYGDHDRFYETYFSAFPGKYFSGDGARRDEDGDYWITGRVDDVLNISGHRIGTAEVESALVAHEKVAEAAAVGCPHKIKGECIYLFVTLNAGVEATDDLQKELVSWVRTQIGPIATPEFLQFSPDLPKTRSGKIMRRILRKIATNELETLGDTSTLSNPDIVESLIQNRLNHD